MTTAISVAMARTLTATIVVALIAAGCATSDGETAQDVDLVGTTWLATEIEGAGVVDGAKSTLGFVDPGRVAGQGGCNRYFGGVAIDGQSMEFGKMGSTMMACPPPLMEQEQRYLAALGAAKRFELKDGTLLLFGEGPDPLVRFSQLESEAQ